MNALVVIALAIAAVALLVLTRVASNRMPGRRPPVFEDVPFVGGLLGFLKGPIGVAEEGYRRFGEVCGRRAKARPGPALHACAACPGAAASRARSAHARRPHRGNAVPKPPSSTLHFPSSLLARPCPPAGCTLCKHDAAHPFFLSSSGRVLRCSPSRSFTCV